jgi:type I restriction enzyme S subunit
MELKQGFKQTEVGVIPEDWQVKTMAETGENIIGLTYNPKDVKEYGHLVLRSSNIQNNKLAFENNVFVEMELPKRVIVKENDILICVRNGSKQLIGKCALIDKATEGSAFGAFMSVYRTTSAKYIFHQFQSNVIQRQIDEVMGATINQLTNKNLASFKIPFPKEEAEQTAIATALSNIDELISQTEKLIDKKKAIKQGVMQELLKPKEGWVTKKLDDIAIFRRGSFPQPYGLDKWYDDISGKPFVQVYDVDDNKKLKIETKRYISSEAQQMSVFAKEGTIILTIQGSIGRIAITQYDAYIDRTLLIFESYKYDFDKYFFMHTIHQLFELEKQNAPGGIIKTITKEALRNFKISYPDFAEQKNIGITISDLEKEIILIESKLQKQKLQKQGMMQALLTGKIRLI